VEFLRDRRFRRTRRLEAYFSGTLEKVTAKITSFCSSSQREEINMDPAPQNRSRVPKLQWIERRDQCHGRISVSPHRAPK